MKGINELRAKYQQKYGSDPGAAYYSAGGYTPIIPLTYWSFRLMIGLGLVAAAIAAWILWATRRGRYPGEPAAALAGDRCCRSCRSSPTRFGWIFTEMGRQPWAVFGLMTTAHGVSPGVSVTKLLISLDRAHPAVRRLAVVEVRLMLTYIRRPALTSCATCRPGRHADGPDRPLAFAY